MRLDHRLPAHHRRLLTLQVFVDAEEVLQLPQLMSWQVLEVRDFLEARVPLGHGQDFFVLALLVGHE